MKKSGLLILLLSLAMGACIDAPSGSGNPMTPGEMGGDQGGDMMVTPPVDIPADMPVDMTDPPDLPDPEDMPEDMPEPADMQDMAEDMRERPLVECPIDAQEGSVEGMGTEEDPKVICYATDFFAMNGARDHFVLGRDITITDKWEPVPQFLGRFDGQEFEIKGLFLDNDNVTRSLGECSSVGVNADYQAAGAAYVGAFISELGAGATIENVNFADIAVGRSTEMPLSYPVTYAVGEMGMESAQCYALAGGLFGIVRGNENRGATLRNIKIRGLEAHVGGFFGGLAHDVNFTTIEDVHIMRSQGASSTTSPRVYVENTYASGFIVRALRPNMTRVSARIEMFIDGDPPTPPAELGFVAEYKATSLFIGKLLGGTLSQVAVRGVLDHTGTAEVPGSLGGLVGEVNTSGSYSAVSISNCLADVRIVGNSEFAGGLFGDAHLFFHPLSVRRCGVGVVGQGRASRVEATDGAGAVMGRLRTTAINPPEEDIRELRLESVFLFADLEGERLGCTYADSNADAQGLANASKIYDELLPPHAEPAVESLRECSAGDSLEGLSMGELERLGWFRWDNNNAIIPAGLSPILDEVGFFE